MPTQTARRTTRDHLLAPRPLAIWRDLAALSCRPPLPLISGAVHDFLILNPRPDLSLSSQTLGMLEVR
jgi:hypothetical protein